MESSRFNGIFEKLRQEARDEEQQELLDTTSPQVQCRLYGTSRGGVIAVPEWGGQCASPAPQWVKSLSS